MLVRLEVHEVNKFWPMYKKAMSTVGEIEEPDKVLAALLDESMQCWLITDDDDSLIGFLTTKLGSVEPQGIKIMEVRDLYSLNGIPDEVFLDGMQRLEVFAKQNDCSRIVGYTDNTKLAKKTKLFGYKETIMMVKEV